MPKTFHSYEILKRIGIGGMAEVFKARGFSASGKPVLVCVKRILPHLASNEDFREMFVTEARVAATLRHPNIVRMLDLGRLDEHLFIALEFIDGADVSGTRSRFSECGLSLDFEDAAFIVREALKGLHYAHTRANASGTPMGIVHRDISPGNVMVSRMGTIKVTDFGIAQTRFKTVETVRGVLRGNVRYIAPEQIKGRKIDPRTDVYQCGILFSHLLAGRHPLEGLPVGEAIDRTLAGAIPLPSATRPDLPACLDLIVAKATATDPEKRFRSALEFQDILEAAASQAGLALDGQTFCEKTLQAFDEASGQFPAAGEPETQTVQVRVDDRDGGLMTAENSVEIDTDEL